MEAEGKIDRSNKQDHNVRITTEHCPVLILKTGLKR